MFVECDEREELFSASIAATEDDVLLTADELASDAVLLVRGVVVNDEGPLVKDSAVDVDVARDGSLLLICTVEEAGSTPLFDSGRVLNDVANVLEELPIPDVLLWVELRSGPAVVELVKRAAELADTREVVPRLVSVSDLADVEVDVLLVSLLSDNERTDGVPLLAPSLLDRENVASPDTDQGVVEDSALVVDEP